MNTLIHICCAPCANRPIARLREEGLSSHREAFLLTLDEEGQVTCVRKEGTA